MAEKVERRLTVIVSADVVGYARLTEADEAGTRAALNAHREALIDGKIADHQGRIVKTMGDGFLIEFPSVVEAVLWAVAVQRGMESRNADTPADRRIIFRIGINIGDVIIEDDDIHGEGVNVAARLQTLAEPGGICISGESYRQVEGKVDVGFADLGDRTVKNIAKPIRVYRVLLDPEAAGTLVEQGEAKKRQSGRRRWAIPAAAFVVVIAIAAGVLLSLEPWLTRVEQASIERMAFALPDKPSIAVLPFTNMSNDPEQEFFADGMTEDLITDLSKVSGLFVIARNTTFTYKGRAVKVRQVAEELGVRYVLEGSVRRQGGRVRINAQLIDATGGHHVWAERYDRDATDIFAIQDEVAGEIVSALEVKLTVAEQAKLEQRPTDNLQAYELYLRGLDAYKRFTPEANNQARKWTEQAIAIDPEFALAHEGLGYTYFIEWALGWSDDPTSLDRAFEFAQKSLALDPYRPGAHALISHVYLWQKQIDQAISEAETAVDLSPNNADGYSDLGEVLTWAGRPEEAIELIKHAMRLNPEHPFIYAWHLGHAYWLAGQLDDAVSVLNEVVAQNPDWMPAHAYLMASYAELGLQEEVSAEKAELARLLSDSSIEALRRKLPYKKPEHLERLISACRKAGLPEHPSLALPDKPSIAVLPFTNMSDDPEQEWFADGMTDDLITDLSNISGLFVIARNTSSTYKDKAVDVKVVGRDLGVRYVLEGSVRRAGNTIRINAQLIDTQTGGHVWAEKYDRELKDVFAVQTEVARQVVKVLAVTLKANENERLFQKYTTNIDAYDVFLQARRTVDAPSKSNILRGEISRRNCLAG